MVNTDVRPFFKDYSRTLQGLFKDNSTIFKDSFPSEAQEKFVKVQ